MENIGKDTIRPLHAPSPVVAREAMQTDIACLDEELAGIQDKVELWKHELELYMQSESDSHSAAAIAKKVEAENLLKEVGEIEEEVYILLDELDTENRTSDQTSKLPTKAEWATFLNRPATAIMPLVAKLEGEHGAPGRLQKWREMPTQ